MIENTFSLSFCVFICGGAVSALSVLCGCVVIMLINIIVVVYVWFVFVHFERMHIILI